METLYLVYVLPSWMFVAWPVYSSMVPVVLRLVSINMSYPAPSERGMCLHASLPEWVMEEHVSGSMYVHPCHCLKCSSNQMISQECIHCCLSTGLAILASHVSYRTNHQCAHHPKPPRMNSFSRMLQALPSQSARGFVVETTPLGLNLSPANHLPSLSLSCLQKWGGLHSLKGLFWALSKIVSDFPSIVLGKK